MSTAVVTFLARGHFLRGPCLLHPDDRMSTEAIEAHGVNY